MVQKVRVNALEVCWNYGITVGSSWLILLSPNHYFIAPVTRVCFILPDTRQFNIPEGLQVFPG